MNKRRIIVLLVIIIVIVGSVFTFYGVTAAKKQVPVRVETPVTKPTDTP